MKLYEIVCHFRPLIISLVVCTNTFLILTFKFLLLMLQFLLTFGLWADNMLYFLSLLIEISDLLSDLDASTQNPVVWVFCADLLSYQLYKVFTDIFLNLRTFENRVQLQRFEQTTNIYPRIGFIAVSNVTIFRLDLNK